MPEPRGRPIAWKPNQVIELLEQLQGEGIKRPTYRHCKVRGYEGCRFTFNKIYKPWLIAKGLPLLAQTQKQVEHRSRDRKPKPASVPIDQLTPSELAVKQYRAAVRVLGIKP